MSSKPDFLMRGICALGCLNLGLTCAELAVSGAASGNWPWAAFLALGVVGNVFFAAGVMMKGVR